MLMTLASGFYMLVVKAQTKLEAHMLGTHTVGEFYRIFIH